MINNGLFAHFVFVFFVEMPYLCFDKNDDYAEYYCT